MINALKLVNKKIEDIEVVVNGSGAAGIAVTRLLMSMGLRKLSFAIPKVQFMMEETT